MEKENRKGERKIKRGGERKTERRRNKKRGGRKKKKRWSMKGEDGGIWARGKEATRCGGRLLRSSPTSATPSGAACGGSWRMREKKVLS